MRTLKLTIVGITILLSAILFIACSSNEFEQVDLVPTPDSNGVVMIDIEGIDRAYSTRSITVDAGREVEIQFHNTGWLDHNWILIDGDINPLTATEADAIQAADSGILSGGEETVFNFQAPSEPGTYIFVCTVIGHAQEGMLGDFIVQ